MLKTTLITHALGITFTVFVGMCAVLPSVLAPLALGGHYQGLEFLYIDDEYTYRARIQEILDGHYLGSSTNVYEYKKIMGVVPPINDFVYALPAIFFGLAFVIVLSKFLFPALIFLLTYVLVFNILKEVKEKNDVSKKWNAIAAGLLVSLSTTLINKSLILSILTGVGEYAHLLIWTRLQNPAVGGILLFGFLALLPCIIRTSRPGFVVIAAISLAASVGYFFSFALASCILGSLMGIFLLRKEFDVIKRLGVVFVLALIVDIPYWYMSFLAMGGEEGEILAQRNGMIFTHEPVLNKALLATTIFVVVSFVYAYVIKKWRDDEVVWQYILALLLGSWVAFNHQIVTGKQISFEHFQMYTVPICFIAVATVSFLVWRRQFPKIWKFGIGVVIICCVFLLVHSAASFRFKIDEFQKLQSNAEIFSFLDEHAEKDCVVFIKEEDTNLEKLIPAYTSCNVYSTTYLFNGITSERILHNFLVRLRLLEINPEELHEYLIAQERPVRNYFFTTWEQDFGVGLDPWFLGRVAMIEEEYAKFLKGDLRSQILTYRMDYLTSGVPLSPSVLALLPGLSYLGNYGGQYFYAFPKE